MAPERLETAFRVARPSDCVAVPTVGLYNHLVMKRSKLICKISSMESWNNILCPLKGDRIDEIFE